MNDSLVRYLRFMLVFAFYWIIFLTGITNFVLGEEEISSLFQRSLTSSTKRSFSGVVLYQRFQDNKEWKVEFKVDHSAPSGLRIEFVTPERLQGLAIYRSAEALWMKRIEKNELERFYRETKMTPLRRFFRQGEWPELVYLDLLFQNYGFEKKSPEIVADRKTNHIIVETKVTHYPRPHAHFWIDQQYNMLMKYKRVEWNGKLSEFFTFKTIDLDAEFPDDNFSIEGFERIATFGDDEKEDITLDFKPLYPNWLPTGFKRQYEKSWNGRHGPTFNLVFTDGLAKLSIFQYKMDEKEIQESIEEQKKHKSRLPLVKKLEFHGGDIFIRDIDEVRVWAMGDLPPEPIMKILADLCCSRR